MSEPKFNIGDRVLSTRTGLVGTVVKIIETTYKDVYVVRMFDITGYMDYSSYAADLILQPELPFEGKEVTINNSAFQAWLEKRDE
jgi:ribosomal 30S subunit maturation factor RimM